MNSSLSGFLKAIVKGGGVGGVGLPTLHLIGSGGFTRLDSSRGGRFRPIKICVTETLV